jgi:hypothetical protein
MNVVGSIVTYMCDEISVTIKIDLLNSSRLSGCAVTAVTGSYCMQHTLTTHTLTLLTQHAVNAGGAGFDATYSASQERDGKQASDAQRPRSLPS